MVLFAVALAWFSSNVALENAVEQFEYRFHQSVIGEVYSLPEFQGQESAWQASWLNPLFAAPELEKLSPHFTQELNILVSKKVDVNGADAKTSWKWKNYALDWTGPGDWAGIEFKHKTDPVYVQPYSMRVRWNAVSPNQLKARTPGYPGL